MRVLLLGGTGEARALAVALQGSVSVISSLAGRVSNPAMPVGEVRIGGFGGVDGLVAYLRAETIDAIVDATHPFAATMSEHAAAAASQASIPLLALRRPGWTERTGDQWIRVASIEDAAALVAASPLGTVFLTSGKRDLAAFADDSVHHYLIRAVDPPETELPPSHTVLLDRGPYTLDGELAIMRSHHVKLLVTKDSGGSMTVAKLDAARELGIPVIVVDRPPLPAGVSTVGAVDEVLTWIRSRGSVDG